MSPILINDTCILYCDISIHNDIAHFLEDQLRNSLWIKQPHLYVCLANPAVLSPLPLPRLGM